jgi:AcrR family transcriptional regulator
MNEEPERSRLTGCPGEGTVRPVAGEPAFDRRRLRHEATKEELLGAAWGLARTRGLTGFSVRDLAFAVHMRNQSLYTYFPSKHAIYDAMFAQGMRALVDQRAGLALDGDPTRALRQAARAFVAFCVQDPVRFQLLFERVVPDFVPSATSMELSAEALRYLEAWHNAAGLTDLADVDLGRAVLTGLAGQQIANDPGGTRWTQLVDRAIDGLLGTARHPAGKRATIRRRSTASAPKEMNK